MQTVLDHRKTYISPLGRVCKVLPRHPDQPEAPYHIVYQSREGEREADDGFSLSVDNIYTIKRFSVVGGW